MKWTSAIQPTGDPERPIRVAGSPTGFQSLTVPEVEALIAELRAIIAPLTKRCDCGVTWVGEAPCWNCHPQPAPKLIVPGDPDRALP